MNGPTARATERPFSVRTRKWQRWAVVHGAYPDSTRTLCGRVIGPNYSCELDVTTHPEVTCRSCARFKESL